MTISAKVIADTQFGKNRITTLELEYPRFIHAEFLRHRDFSHSVASSRAIPVKRMIRDIRKDPAMPVWWSKAQKGMKGHKQVDGFRLWAAKKLWMFNMQMACTMAYINSEYLGLHKEIANRPLEVYQHTKQVVTSSKWNNFFALRIHEQAQSEICELAIAIKNAINQSTPKTSHYHISHFWHLPYVTEEDMNMDFSGHDKYDLLRRISAARCARVSYNLHSTGKRSDIKSDIDLANALAYDKPVHASPFEHQATSGLVDRETTEFNVFGKLQRLHPNVDYGGNFGPNFIQYRKLISSEYVR